jgi:hypothetical protein
VVKKKNKEIKVEVLGVVKMKERILLLSIYGSNVSYCMIIIQYIQNH